ncbi:MAG: hypothetical protein KDD58_06100 [Bdellovibrionales bacterium]|nr:hypothetical protein [Bdellovibrionales bacterium]
MERLVSLLGLVCLVAMAYAISKHRKHVDFRIVATGLGLQLILALLVLGVPGLGIPGPFRGAFELANDFIVSLLNFTVQGSKFIFGDLLDVKKSGFIFAFQVLPTIIFMASVMAIFYHLGIMQKIVSLIAVVMQKVMKTSGAETLSVAANIFVGQTEAPLMIKPFVAKMTRSELLAVMIGGMATVAGGVMAAYVGLLKDRIPDIAGHLLTASIMSAPAALAISKILLPETEKPETMGAVPQDVEGEKYSNIIEAAAQGAGEGLYLALNVGAMLLAFIAIIAGADALLGAIGGLINFHEWGGALTPDLMLKPGELPQLNLSLVLGWLFSPIAFLLGIPVSEIGLAGSLLGQKIVLNEFVAYLNLSQVGEQLSDRTTIILSYALCGFANFSSIAIQIGGIGGIAPSRKKDLAQLGIKSVIGGSLAAFMTAAIAGILL